MEVKHSDKKQEVYYLQMACNMVGFGLDYPNTDLILRMQQAVKKKKGKFSISDAVDIQMKWKEDWDFYFQRLKTEQKNKSED